MKFLLSASASSLSLSRCLLRQASTKKRYVTTAAAAAATASSGGYRSVWVGAVVHENQSHKSNIIGIDMSRPCRRLMGTSACASVQEQENDYDDVEVQEANER